MDQKTQEEYNQRMAQLNQMSRTQLEQEVKKIYPHFLEIKRASTQHLVYTVLQAEFGNMMGLDQ